MKKCHRHFCQCLACCTHSARHYVCRYIRCRYICCFAITLNPSVASVVSDFFFFFVAFTLVFFFFSCTEARKLQCRNCMHSAHSLSNTRVCLREFMMMFVAPLLYSCVFGKHETHKSDREKRRKIHKRSEILKFDAMALCTLALRISIKPTRFSFTFYLTFFFFTCLVCLAALYWQFPSICDFNFGFSWNFRRISFISCGRRLAIGKNIFNFDFSIRLKSICQTIYINTDTHVNIHNAAERQQQHETNEKTSSNVESPHNRYFIDLVKYSRFLFP